MELQTIPIADGDVADRYIVYRPLLGAAFVANRAMADLTRAIVARRAAEATAIERLPGAPEAREGVPGADRAAEGSGAPARFLDRIGFLAPDPPPPALRRTFKPVTAVLLLTNQCQLRCTYCYAAAGALPARRLSVDLGCRAIDHVSVNASELGYDHFEVAFHGGGEPTFAWSVLQHCTRHARGKTLPAEITLTSNAVWSRRQCDWISTNIDHLSLSVDGDVALQDRQRPFASGRGSADIVLRNLATLDGRGKAYGLRLTATAPWVQLPAAVGFLCATTACRHMQVEPAFNAGRGGHGMPTSADCDAFADAFLEAFDVAADAGCSLTCSAARPGTVAASFCGAPYDALIVNADGHLGTCYEIDNAGHPLAGISTIGCIDGAEVRVNHAARDRLHGLLDARRAACEGCFSYHSCAGDCYARRFQPGVDGHLAHGPRCDMNRRILRELLLRLIEMSGGVWRMPTPAAPMQASGEPGEIPVG